ncbi:MAG: DNA-protecting protein DprA [candidate division Zixibacteria bacterium]|nr:DNA-protecting protein DprA [candidate division Zixibacteria bacterium]
MIIHKREQDEHIIQYLGLRSINGIGDIRFRSLIEHFGSVSAVFDASTGELSGLDGISRELASTIKRGFDRDSIVNTLKEINSLDIKIITLDDADYPKKVKQLHDPPPYLYCRGDASLLNTNSVAVVGSRKASSYGMSIAENISRELVEAGFSVVSGFARGIDTIAHKTVLENNGGTIAVMGCGLDRIYPPENKTLFKKLCESGCALAEFEPGIPPEGRNFPRRNRIISGLSAGVVIVEATEKSGALLTARHALDQGREVFAFPGPVNSLSSSGTNQLIKNGAKLTTSVQDILEELKIQLKTPLISKSEKSTMDKLSGEQRLIYKSLDSNGLHVDRIAGLLKLDMPRLLSHLMELELSGYIRSLPGKRFARN